MPSNPSWSWRKILQSRDWCKGWFINRIGNGNSTSLWFDYWLPGGLRLIDNYPLRTLTATGLNWNARGHPSGLFSIKTAWELLRDKRLVNNMHQLLWFKGHIPRQSFILWLAGLGRLRTMDRLRSAGILQNTALWQTVNARANINWPSSSWHNLLQWASATYSNKTDVTHIIARLLLSTAVYQLWYERNNRIFSIQFQTAPTIAETIFQLVRLHITFMEFKSIIPTSICDVWGIQQPHQNRVPTHIANR
ncbi:uncharacterized protein LOC133680749 [Populus nigra]|uniref:uncharacterized protein LOC133680749 n=1 Tax=Populus nigra TaxID=3691 RepID=UPI002B27967E|nr:uncharacterized protein LOC133680749 [Populus nigra]